MDDGRAPKVNTPKPKKFFTTSLVAITPVIEALGRQPAAGAGEGEASKFSCASFIREVAMELHRSESGGSANE